MVVTNLARKGRCTTVIKGTGGRRVMAGCLVIFEVRDVAQERERVVGDHEAAGAIPVIPTNSVVQSGHRALRSSVALCPVRAAGRCLSPPRKRRCNSGRCSQRHRSAERDTILRRSSAEVQLLSVAPRFCVAPSGTVPDSNPGRAAFDSLAAC